MVDHYTSGGLIKVVTKLQAFIGSTRALVAGGVLGVGDAASTGADIVSVCKTLDGLSAALNALAKGLRRQGRIILTIDTMGKAIGESVDLTAFISECHAEDLDYLVAIGRAKRNPGWITEFYLRCRDGVLGLCPDGDIGSDIGSEDPGSCGSSGHLDPQGSVDYR